MLKTIVPEQDHRRAAAPRCSGGPSQRIARTLPRTRSTAVGCGAARRGAACRRPTSSDDGERGSARRGSASRQNSLICSTRTRLWSSTAISTAPRNAPMTVPEPPSVLTPPTTAAAIAASSSPEPAVTLIVPNRPTYRNPARPASAPQATKAAICDAALVEPGLAGGVRVGADGVEVAPAAQCTAGRGAATTTMTSATRTSCAPRSCRCVNTVLRGRSTSQSGSEPVAIVSPPAWLGQHAAVDRERAERDDDRRHPGEGDEQPLTSPSTAPIADREQRPRRPPGRSAVVGEQLAGEVGRRRRRSSRRTGRCCG